jgi:subtilisin-like proprotein convertase family protein
MKLVKLLSAVILFAGLHAQAESHTFSESPSLDIPDGNGAGMQRFIDVTGVVGWITNMTVSLDVLGGANGDLYCYLESDNGGQVVLLNRVGKTVDNPLGYDDLGMFVTFDDSAPADIHNYGGNAGVPLLGAWQPDGRTVVPQLVLDTDPRTAMLSSFNGRDANGKWTLFIADLTGGSQSTLLDWSFTFEAVPEPAGLSLMVLGGGMLAITLSRRRRRSLS